jgi:glycosyltransferase involved in cell wall biosynthesis
VRNEASSIDELIDAVRDQSRPPDEWVVVDGGSKDDTVERLERAGTCRVIVGSGNIARGRNTAVHLASGDLIAVTDAGCRPERRWLEHLVRPLEQGLAPISAGRTRPRIQHPIDAAQWALLDQFAVAGLRVPALSARSLAFLRSVWQECPFPEWLDTGEDTWLFLAWQRRGLAIRTVEDAIVDWQPRPTLAAWWRQHFSYQRGEGRAFVHSRRQALRFGYYAALATLSGGGAPAWAGAAFVAYLAASGLRLPPMLGGKRASFIGGAVALLPVALVVMDVAKMTGYLAGLGKRLAADRGALQP